MDYKEQIDRLRSEVSELENSELAVELFDGLITDLLARAAAEEARAEKAEREVERLKGIMRSEGIMVIPSKYPGCKSEWNLSKRGRKEE